MKVTAVYFSPTGNTKKSVEAMAAALSEQYEVLDLTAYEKRAVEREFGVKFTMKEVSAMQNVGEMIDIIAERA